jgi:hypothetical protein
MGFRYGRAGGAQEGSPNRGWIWGLTDYEGRFQSTLTNYLSCRDVGASFIVVPHDIWGTDQVNSSSVWPGDNGDWSDYDNFVMQLMSDFKANNATDGLVWDIWNEPDNQQFWVRSQQQWLDLYVRTHQLLRGDSDFDSVLISGPTLYNAPDPSNTWWTNYLEQIKGNDTIPDQYAYHLLIGPNSPSYDLANAYPTLNSMLSSNSLPQRQHMINEFAAWVEEVPAGTAWWISRLERYNVLGLRGNYQNGDTLHDIFANLLTKSDPTDYAATDYMPAPDYSVYQYYNTNMTGVRMKTTGSDDSLFDVYATANSGDKVRILTGTQLGTGGWTVSVNNMTGVGLPSNGTVDVQIWAFDGSNVWNAYWAPTNISISSYDYADNSLSLLVYQATNYTAVAFEFSCGNF